MYHKQEVKGVRIKQNEYNRLNELITHFLARQKKDKKKNQDAIDLKEHKQLKH